MIHFAWLWMLLFLPLPWLSRRLLPHQPLIHQAVFFPLARGMAAEAPTAHDAPRWYHRLRLLLWLLFILAAMRPQWLGTPRPIAQTGRLIMLAIDVSGSMATPDMARSRSRLAVVQEVAGTFIKQREGDQIGLIVFGSHPYLQSPFTQDLETANRFLQEALVGEAGSATAIGDAIGLALQQRQSLQQSHNAQSPMVLILLTDGGNNAGLMPPEEAARLAAHEHLRIYTIGVGAPVEHSFFGASGNTDLDETTLKSIARLSGGLYFRATDAEALSQVYQRINQLEPVPGQAHWYRPTTDYFYWPLALALLLSLLLAAFREY